MRRRLLLVEDHEELAEATAEFIRRAGVEVCIAKSGKEALQIGTSLHLDIVLCDLRLPDMSGLQVARAFKEKPKTRNALFAICTAMTEREIRSIHEELCQNGVDIGISKPINLPVIEKLLAMSAAKRAS